MNRRQLCAALGWLGLGSLAVHLGACAGPLGSDDDEDDELPDPQLPDGVRDNLIAAMDVIIPGDAGAVEAGALEVLALERFVPLARSLGLLPALPPDWQDAIAGGLDPLFETLLAAELDAMAFERQALTPFRYLGRADQEEAIALAFEDPRRRPVMAFLRSICMWAWLGAVVNDAGLRAIGFPPFESFDDRRAVSGYPRTTAGRLIDAENEDLVQLAAAGELDDYTSNQAPAPTAGDDLSLVLDARGDLR
jgi:hypothetical protein